MGSHPEESPGDGLLADEAPGAESPEEESNGAGSHGAESSGEGSPGERSYGAGSHRGSHREELEAGGTSPGVDGAATL
jgi:hypothetical protein